MSLASQVKSKLNIVDVILQDGLPLKKEGVDRFSCCCPFHTEKTPSFKVDESFQRFKCFGCGVSGDVIEYYAKQNTLDYRTATLLLAEKLGIKINKKNQENYSNQKRYLELAKELENYYRSEFDKLDDNHPAKRQITDRNLTIDNDYFGYAPNCATSVIEYLTKVKNFTKKEMKEVGFITEKENIQLRDRLVFFIRNYLGQTVGFSGRELSKEPTNWKYINSKNSLLFDKSNVLYNIDKAKKKAREENCLYLVEGQFDVIAMIQNGYENTVAISGTTLTNKQVEMINRCVNAQGKIILVLDNDKAGKKATVRLFQQLPNIQSYLYVCSIPNGKDPCDFFNDGGKRLPQEKKVIDLLFNSIKKKYPPNIITNRQVFLEEVQEKITKYITDSTLKEVYLRTACSTVGISYESLQQKSVQQYTKQTQAKSEQVSLSKEDKLYIHCLSIIVKNKEYLIRYINTKHYPKRYHNFIQELLEDKNKRFIPEEYKKSVKIAEIISNQENVKKLEDFELAKKYYRFILQLAHKETKRILLENRKIEVVNALQGLDPDNFIKVLKGVVRNGTGTSE